MRNGAIRRYLKGLRREWRHPELRAIAFLALIIVAVAFAFPQGPQDDSKDQAATNTKEQQSKAKSFWIWRIIGKTTDDPVALFTFVLSASTIGLWIVTWNSERRQSRETRIALREARRAGIAARDSARTAKRALELTERAFIRITVSTLVPLKIGDHVRIRSEIANDGNTPAATTGTYGHTEIASDVPKEMTPEFQKRSTVYIGPRGHVGLESFNDEYILTDAALTDINRGNKKIYHVALIKYIDAFDIEHETCVGVFYDVGKRAFGFIEGEKYNYST
jgi:hypothetical protein